MASSALHVYAIASELHRRCLSPAIAVPNAAYTVEDVGRPPFPVLTYRQVRRGRLRFPDGRGPDLVHAFTPRELVRELTADVVESYGCPYVVHLEDNEDAIISAAFGGAEPESLRALPSTLLDEIVARWQSHPQRAREFLERAAGATVVIDRLLELVPARAPAALVRAGFDEAVLTPARSRDETRAKLGLEVEDFAVLYTGNIHAANVRELHALWSAVATLRNRGRQVVLVKTGLDTRELDSFPDLGDGLRDLGWVPRTRIPELLAAADALIQPGRADRFNDYRLPSKLPEFFASGRPVVLPRTNVGLLIENEREALLLERGDAEEIAGALDRLASRPELRRRLGEGGRAFALRELRWGRSVDAVEELYRRVAAAGRPPTPAWAIRSVDPPVRLIAIVDQTPGPAEVRAARAHGIYGFCLTEWPAQDVPDAPFCVVVPVRQNGSSTKAVPLAEVVSHPVYLRSDGEPVVFGVEGHATASGTEVTSFEAGIERPGPFGSPAAYSAAMTRRLAAEVSTLPRFRGVPAPPDGARDVYVAWLRKLTLQAILLAGVREPVVFLDLRAVAHEGRRESLLNATLLGLTSGATQAYASRGIRLAPRDAERIFNLP